MKPVRLPPGRAVADEARADRIDEAHEHDGDAAFAAEAPPVGVVEDTMSLLPRHCSLANCCVKSLLKPHQRVDREIAAVDPAEISANRRERRKRKTLIFSGAVFGRCHQEADATQARNLLRARHERPCGYAAADQRDEIPSPHRSPLTGKPTLRAACAVQQTDPGVK